MGFIDGLLILVGTVFTLMAFTFTTRRRRGLVGWWGRLSSVAAFIGRVFLIVALAVAFAGAVTASLSIFVGRVQYMIEGIVNFVPGL
jgi:multisubunit Na+/H+ antiporter MnhB subunit